MILTNKKEQVRFIKFGLVGAFGAIIDFAIFNLLIQLLNIKPLYASIVSFIYAVLSNFFLNRYWTYPDSRLKPFQHQFFQFFIVSIVGLGIRTVLFKPFENFFTSLTENLFPKTFFLTPTTIGYNLTLALLILIVMFWNFFVNRFWTYNDVGN